MLTARLLGASLRRMLTARLLGEHLGLYAYSTAIRPCHHIGTSPKTPAVRYADSTAIRL